jgi:hemoglobin
VSLYDELGGDAAIAAALERFYEKVLADPIVNVFFQRVDVDRVKQRQRAFLAVAFGGPGTYDGRDLRTAHAAPRARGLGDEEYEVFMGALPRHPRGARGSRAAGDRGHGDRRHRQGRRPRPLTSPSAATSLRHPARIPRRRLIPSRIGAQQGAHAMRDIMTSELADRIDRILTLLLGALYVTGPTWCILALALGGWPQLLSVPLYLAVAATAYVTGTAVLLWGWRRGPLDWRAAAVLAALGSGVIALGATTAGPIGATAFGGLYTYVTAISFLWFPLPVALAQLALAGVTYAAALQVSGAPGGIATWALVMGTATAGAGVVGLLASRFRRLYLDEAQLAVKLAEADELKSTFLQAVSHELRTPLAAVQGYTETLDEHLHRMEAEQVSDMLGRLRGASRRLDGLLGDLLDVERLRRGAVPPRRAPCEVAPLLAEALDELVTDTHEVELDLEDLVANVEAAKLERIVGQPGRQRREAHPAGDTRARTGTSMERARPAARRGGRRARARRRAGDATVRALRAGTRVLERAEARHGAGAGGHRALRGSPRRGDLDRARARRPRRHVPGAPARPGRRGGGNAVVPAAATVRAGLSRRVGAGDPWAVSSAGSCRAPSPPR